MRNKINAEFSFFLTLKKAIVISRSASEGQLYGSRNNED
jgi:hypothetical protein